MQRDVGRLHFGHGRKILPHEDQTAWSPLSPGAGVLEGLAVAQGPLEVGVRFPERDQWGLLRILYELDGTGAHRLIFDHLVSSWRSSSARAWTISTCRAWVSVSRAARAADTVPVAARAACASRYVASNSSWSICSNSSSSAWVRVLTPSRAAW